MQAATCQLTALPSRVVVWPTAQTRLRSMLPQRHARAKYSASQPLPRSISAMPSHVRCMRPTLQTPNKPPPQVLQLPPPGAQPQLLSPSMHAPRLQTGAWTRLLEQAVRITVHLLMLVPIRAGLQAIRTKLIRKCQTCCYHLLSFAHTPCAHTVCTHYVLPIKKRMSSWPLGTPMQIALPRLRTLLHAAAL